MEVKIDLSGLNKMRADFSTFENDCSKEIAEEVKLKAAQNINLGKDSRFGEQVNFSGTLEASVVTAPIEQGQTRVYNTQVYADLFDKGILSQGDVAVVSSADPDFRNWMINKLGFAPEQIPADSLYNINYTIKGSATGFLGKASALSQSEVEQKADESLSKNLR